ncbi:bifunctional glycosyltransferase/CDP-glycerol:glycerophosphate glycerophosphotransferase [Terrilactibacillus laevilacticus]|uniref:bifunctional glycosyltransferase/CDP-glycerol:glycerophosphate glycerophosphotransferase n=1 Tax=Terrilactibacillus laevilacticus TaxID=1380157 RepID=UPI0011468FAC|nr:CDP-glycerol:glycerophosphate glycerophosphotransferase [Terrilactibacillus laevilacticus]
MTGKKRKNKVKVSVIVPLYNVETLINETIEILLKQTLKEIEFILIDDGSTDNTYNIALSYAKGNSSIKLVKQENGGPAAARNHGLRLARGEFICFVDADDQLTPDALKVMYDAAIKHKCSLVTGGAMRFNSKRKWHIKAHLEKGLMKPGIKHISNNPELIYSIGPWGKLYKHTLIKDFYFPENIRFAEDQPLVLYAYLKAKRIYTVDSIVYLYRMREGDDKSLTQKINENPLLVLNYVMQMLKINKETFNTLNIEPKLQAYYYERVMTYEIWPAFRAVINSRNNRIQKEGFYLVANWIDSLDNIVFNKIPAIRYFLIRETINRFISIKYRSRASYVKLLKIILSKMDEKSANAFLNRHRVYMNLALNSVRSNSTSSIHKYSLKKKFKSKFNKKRIENIFLKRIIFRIASSLPVKRKKIVLATNKSNELRGNLRSIYDEIFYKHKDWKLYVFINENRNFYKKVKQYFHLGNARVIVLDDYFNQLYHLKIRPETEVLQSWHACGAFKKFGFSAQGYRDSNSLYFEEGAHSIYTKVLTSSKNLVKYYAEAFNKKETEISPVGVPRTDMFFDEERISYTKRNYLLKYPALKNKKILLYAPTFRGTPKERTNFKLKLDLNLMKKALSKDYVLILKLHPAVLNGIKIPQGLKDFVLDLSNVNDINELLVISDALITDYSSVIFEYSLLKRPIIFYAYDLEEYLSERGFYFNYQDLVPGPITYSTNEVINYINDFPNNNKLNEFVDFFFDYKDNLSTDRVVKLILNK